jgi:hypothetical protein
VAVTLPVVNGSSGTWGTILNAALTDIDTRLTTATTSIGTQDTDIGSLKTRVTTLEGATSAGGKLTVATSGTRPALAVGQIVLETDTGFLYYAASVNGVATRVPFPGSYVAKLKRTTTQNYGNNSAGALQYNTADFDRLAGWNGGTPSRYTAQVPGSYEFAGAISYETNATGYRQVTWYVNGTAQNTSNAVVAAATGESTVAVARTITLKLAAGDYVEMYGLQNSGSTLATDVTTAFQPGMQVKYLGYNV